MYAVFYAFQLAYGLQIGSSVYNAIDPNSSEEGLCGQTLVSPWFYIPLLPILSIAIALSYGSSHKQWISQIISVAIAFGISYFLGKVIPDGQIVGSIAAFAIGLYSNFALKVTGEPPLAPLCVGVTLLVPGSIGKFYAVTYLKSFLNQLFFFSFWYRCKRSIFSFTSLRFRSKYLSYENADNRTRIVGRFVRFGYDCLSVW